MSNKLIRMNDVKNLLKKWITDDEADFRETGYDNTDYDMALQDVLTALENIKVRNAVEVPCKIGDTMWGIRRAWKRGYVKKGAVSRIRITDDMEVVAMLSGVCWGTVGKSIFRTREEAEAALKKMEDAESNE